VLLCRCPVSAAEVVTAIQPIEGIVIDPATKSFEVCGHRMAVGNLQHSRYAPGHKRDRSATPAAIVELIEERNPGFFDRWQGPMPEAIHANLLCGENGWWVEVHVWPGDPEYPAGLSIGLPDDPYDPSEDWTAEDLLALWRATCARRDAAPDWQSSGDPGPFCGVEPGTWDWDG
jgi:hypothetical protein